MHERIYEQADEGLSNACALPRYCVDFQTRGQPLGGKD